MKIENFLTKVKPGTLAIVVIVLALIIYLIFNKVKSGTAKTAVDSIAVNPGKLTFSSSELEFKTSQLFDAMNQYGTDFDTIIFVLRSLNDGNDLLYIIKSFGTKPYFLTGLADGLVTRFMGTDENLIGWFHEELTTNQLNDVTTEFNRLGVKML
jgi:hypothetical protein